MLPQPKAVGGTDALAYAKRLYRLRRRREDAFPGLFGEPAWDILLDLFIAETEGRRTSVSSLCIAASVPPTTGLRWISIMLDRGILTRSSDGDDKRRAYIGLASGVSERVGQMLRASIEGDRMP